LVEYRYPYLDRDLLEFSYAIPREQWVRPGQRRSLTRRALVGIVPNEVLNRKRKAYVSHTILSIIRQDWPQLMALTEGMACQSLGFIDAGRLSQTLVDALAGRELHVVGLMRTMALESWLRTALTHNRLDIRSEHAPLPGTTYPFKRVLVG
jgi:asparagine synthase (glutamine-hydrolysing)